MSKDKSETGTTKARYIDAAQMLTEMQEKLPPDAVRIEIDIEYADGGRVKMEAKA